LTASGRGKLVFSSAVYLDWTLSALMNSISWYPTLIVLLIASVIDIRSRRIPNWLVLPFLLGGLVVSLSGYGSIGWVQSLSGFGLAVAVGGVLCWLRGMGMGDLKLCAAIGAWIGPEQLTVALVVTGITGGLMAVLWAAWHGVLRESFSGAGDLLVSWKTGLRPHATLVLENPAKLKMPYAPAIAIGTIFSFFGT
jgi:prepilin peptidase CpaA